MIGRAPYVGKIDLDGTPELTDYCGSQVEVFTLILDYCRRAVGRNMSTHSQRTSKAVIQSRAFLLYWDRRRNRTDRPCPFCLIARSRRSLPLHHLRQLRFLPRALSSPPRQNRADDREQGTPALRYRRQSGGALTGVSKPLHDSCHDSASVDPPFSSARSERTSANAFSMP